MKTLQDKLPISAQFNKLKGAKLASFGGWAMPTFYSSIYAEYEAVRQQLGLFDVSHMGRQKVSGPEAEAFLLKISCNNISSLQSGRALYTPMLNDNGGIIDDLIIYKLADNDYLVVNNAGNHDLVSKWYLEQAKNFDVHINDVTLTLAQIAVQGPQAETALATMFEQDESLKYFSHRILNYQAKNERNVVIGNLATSPVIISATGYTGERGWELYAEPAVLMEIWQRLIDEHGALPCGLGARDLLRLEAGYCLHGNDISADTSPYEAGLDWTVKNPGDYIGKAHAKRMNKRLVGLAFPKGQKILARSGLEVFAPSQEFAQNHQEQSGATSLVIGKVTSGNYSPILERGIALAYIDEAYYKNHSLGSELIVKIRDKEHIAKIAQPWFYRNIRTKEIQEIK